MKAQNSAEEVNVSFNKDIQFPPLRPLNEFLFDKTRFELPNFNDLPKWNNRIFANLLYFQSNYFLILLSFLLLTSCFKTQEMIIGFVILAICGFLAAIMVSKEEKLLAIRREHPYAILIVLVGVAYCFITYLPFVIVALFSLCFPLLIILIHASTRLRGLNNKLNQKFFEGVIRETVMAKILHVLNVEAKAV
uniref:PRA1 family protein n=1 Tax=Panagrolaimus sp. PS1159 TaxID=55785 RepID=A0AC35GCU4_9BILA